MRTRHKSLSDYGVPEEDIEPLKKYCLSADADDRILLLQCAISAAPGLEISIYDSLVSGKGYNSITNEREIPALKADWYGYQRKTLDKYYKMLRLLGRWKDT